MVRWVDKKSTKGGHMEEIIKKAKIIASNVILKAGNIAKELTSPNKFSCKAIKYGAIGYTITN